MTIRLLAVWAEFHFELAVCDHHLAERFPQQHGAAVRQRACTCTARRRRRYEVWRHLRRYGGGRLLIADIVIAHPTAAAYVGAASRSAGSAAAVAHAKRHAFEALGEGSSYNFVPLAMEL
jgi:hypothetical protein